MEQDLGMEDTAVTKGLRGLALNKALLLLLTRQVKGLAHPRWHPL